MNPRRPARFLNRFVLGVLVLLVTGAALCTVAASAATEEPNHATHNTMGAP